MEEGIFLVSICIPTRNRLNYLRSMLPQILEQANSVGFQVCISDNSSTDGTCDYLRELSINHENVKIKWHEKSLSIDESMHAAISMADGLYIYSIGDDDFLYDNALVLIADELKDSPDLLILNGINTGPNLEPMGEILPVDLQGVYFLDPKSAFSKLNLHYMHFGAFVVKRQFYSDVIIEKYYGTCHAYAGAVWDSLFASYIDTKKCYVKCMSRDVVKLRGGVKSWDNYKFRVLYVDVPNWFSLLPRYYSDDVDLFFEKYNKNYFNFKSFLSIKQSGELTYALLLDVVRANRKLHKIKILYLYVVAFMPMSVAVCIIKLKSFFRRFKWVERHFHLLSHRFWKKIPG